MTLERACLRCHGPDFLPNKQWDADQWNVAIDLMMSTELDSNPPGRINEISVPGLIQGEERKTLVDYLVKNFGPDSKPRGLAVPEVPHRRKSVLGKSGIHRIPGSAVGGRLNERRFHDPLLLTLWER